MSRLKIGGRLEFEYVGTLRIVATRVPPRTVHPDS
jgi:hypothetical protein